VNDTERQLWEWLADCEARKPSGDGVVVHSVNRHADKVVRVLQYGVREGGEAGEVVDPGTGLYCKSQ